MRLHHEATPPRSPPSAAGTQSFIHVPPQAPKTRTGFNRLPNLINNNNKSRFEWFSCIDQHFRSMQESPNKWSPHITNSTFLYTQRIPPVSHTTPLAALIPSMVPSINLKLNCFSFQVELIWGFGISKSGHLRWYLHQINKKIKISMSEIGYQCKNIHQLSIMI